MLLCCSCWCDCGTALDNPNLPLFYRGGDILGIAQFCVFGRGWVMPDATSATNPSITGCTCRKDFDKSPRRHLACVRSERKIWTHAVRSALSGRHLRALFVKRSKLFVPTGIVTAFNGMRSRSFCVAPRALRSPGQGGFLLAPSPRRVVYCSARYVEIGSELNLPDQNSTQ